MQQNLPARVVLHLLVINSLSCLLVQTLHQIYYAQFHHVHVSPLALSGGPDLFALPPVTPVDLPAPSNLTSTSS